MRQAGRYLPEYRKARERAKTFLNLCKTPELASEVTLQPIRRYQFDAAIIFSDILIVPEAMGMELQFIENHGPSFPSPLKSEADVSNLNAVSEEHFDFVAKAIAITVNELPADTPLIGFAGSPWTLATYMVGNKSRDFNEAKILLRDHPEVLSDLLERLSVAVVSCLRAQIKAGARCVMLFDSWGGILNDEDYKRFSLAPLKKIANALKQEHPEIPRILFTRGGHDWLEDMADSDYSALGIDWHCNIGSARERVGERVALQGNLDPSTLHASPDVLRRKVKEIIDCYGPHPGHIFNLGHGIEPQTDPEQVAVLVDAVREFGSH